jgi:hypothetical protein
LVYGYVRSPFERPEYLAGCRDALASWCAREGWNLGAVFTDIASAVDVDGRLGFRGLLDAEVPPGSRTPGFHAARAMVGL